MKAYIATKISNREQALKLAYQLVKAGVQVTSRWIELEDDARPRDEKGNLKKGGPEWDSYATTWAACDEQDVINADILVILPHEHCVGTWVEFGIARGLAKPIYYCGSKNFSVFSYLRGIRHFETIEALRNAVIREMKQQEEI